MLNIKQNIIRKLHRPLAAVAACVMLITSSGFPIAGMAEGEAYSAVPRCGMPEHIHTEDCYPLQLTCGQEESAETVTVREYAYHFTPHYHTDACKDAQGNIACGYVEGEYYHEHNEWCYDDQGTLVCGLEERLPHVHTDACYNTMPMLICGKEEGEGAGHIHDDSCYTYGVDLICGKKEGEDAHTHTEECYKEYDELICGKEEGEGARKHTDACYTWENVLNCDNQDPGHTHTSECYKKTLVLSCGLLCFHQSCRETMAFYGK